MLILLGQSLVVAAISSAITTALLLKITNACQAARDIRDIMFWEKNLREIEAFKEFVPKGR